MEEVMALGLAEPLLLTMTVIAAIIAIKVLIDIASEKHRKKYGRTVKYQFAIGLLLGLTLPWNVEVGLVAAFIMSLILLVLSIGYYLIGGKIETFKFLYLAWAPRERVRDWFLHLSIITGATGIVSTIISVVLPPFLSLTLSPLIPIAFDTISVLSALLEFTIYVPPYNSILALTYNFLIRKKSFITREFYIEDLDFSVITEGTIYTNFEIRDAMESLVTRGFATKISPIPLGKVAFRLNEYGAKFLQTVWNEAYVLLSREKGRIESEVIYLQQRLNSFPELNSSLIKKAEREIRKLRERIDNLLNEYGMIVEQSWLLNYHNKLGEFERHLSRETKPLQEKAIDESQTSSS
jgi:hypothetical protein